MKSYARQVKKIIKPNMVTIILPLDALKYYNFAKGVVVLRMSIPKLQKAATKRERHYDWRCWLASWQLSFNKD